MSRIGDKSKKKDDHEIWQFSALWAVVIWGRLEVRGIDERVVLIRRADNSMMHGANGGVGQAGGKLGMSK